MTMPNVSWPSASLVGDAGHRRHRGRTHERRRQPSVSGGTVLVARRDWRLGQRRDVMVDRPLRHCRRPCKRLERLIRSRVDRLAPSPARSSWPLRCLARVPLTRRSRLSPKWTRSHRPRSRELCDARLAQRGPPSYPSPFTASATPLSRRRPIGGLLNSRTSRASCPGGLGPGGGLGRPPRGGGSGPRPSLCHGGGDRSGPCTIWRWPAKRRRPFRHRRGRLLLPQRPGDRRPGNERGPLWLMPPSSFGTSWPRSSGAAAVSARHEKSSTRLWDLSDLTNGCWPLASRPAWGG